MNTKRIILTEQQQKLIVKSLVESGEIQIQNYGKVKFRRVKAKKGNFNPHLQGKEEEWIQGNWTTSKTLKETLKKIIK